MLGVAARTRMSRWMPRWPGLDWGQRARQGSGVRPASGPASSVWFPHVVLQDDHRLAEAKSSSPGCQLSIVTPLLVRLRVRCCHKPDAALNAGAKGREAFMANATTTAWQQRLLVLNGRLAERACSCSCSRHPHSVDGVLVVRTTKDPTPAPSSRQEGIESSKEASGARKPPESRVLTLACFGQNCPLGE
ncbi:hypothetical protein J3F83DRAFT_717033 [Trichoderma novae-zelandiae]